MIKTLLRYVLCVLLPAAPWAVARDLPQIAVGYAHALDGGPLLYTELHRWQGRWHEIQYRDADGVLFAVNDLDFSHSFASPAYTQRYLRRHFEEGARWRDDRLVLFDDGRQRSVTYRQPLVISSGFFHFVLDHWAQLVAGDTVAFDFAMPSHMKVLALQARRVSAQNSGIDGGEPDWVYFRVQPASRWLAWLVHPLTVAFDAQQRLTVYRGLSNVEVAGGGTPQVLIRYDYDADSKTLAALAAGRTER